MTAKTSSNCFHSSIILKVKDRKASTNDARLIMCIPLSQKMTASKTEQVNVYDVKRNNNIYNL